MSGAWRRGAAPALLLAGFAALCWHGMSWDTPTVDEFAHLPAGYHYLRTGRFELFPLNPPLVKVLCAVGDEVEAGQPLAVLQAMKMENELSLPRGGRVSAINAQEGQTVEQGQVLVVVE